MNVNLGGDFTADGVASAGDTHKKGATERRDRFDIDLRFGQHPQGGKVTQQIRPLVANTGNYAVVTVTELSQWPRRRFDKHTVSIGYRVAVRAGRGITELLRESRLNLIAKDMLEFAGLVMKLIPGQLEIVGQETFAEAMAAHEATAFTPAVISEDDGAVGSARYQASRAQPSKHLRD